MSGPLLADPPQGFLDALQAQDRMHHGPLSLAWILVLLAAAVLGALALILLNLNRRLRRANRSRSEMRDVLQANERRFRFIAEHAGDVIWTLDLARGRFTYVSPSVLALSGYTPEEVMARPAVAALTPESAARIQEELKGYLEGWRSGVPAVPRVTEVELPHKDGHLVYTEVVTTLHGGSEGRPAAVLGITRDITERKRAEAQLRRDFESMEQLASTDLLTGAWNRRRFEESIEGEMHRSIRYGHPLSLILLDVDRFKRVNDAFGHAEGDRVLRGVADCVREAIRVSDSLTRWGGEEFIVLMPDTGLSSATVMAERIREGIAMHLFDGIGRVTASLGLAEYLPSTSLAAWLDRADRAMYQAKRRGRNRVEVDPARNENQTTAEHPENAFLKLVWSDTYRTGNPVIDSHHERLFRLANELLEAVLSGRPRDEISAFIKGLLSEIIQHFHDEEAILKALWFPGLEEHKAAHADLVARAFELEQAFLAGSPTPKNLFQFLAQDVVVEHMLKADREFFPLAAAPWETPGVQGAIEPGPWHTE